MKTPSAITLTAFAGALVGLSFALPAPSFAMQECEVELSPEAVSVQAEATEIEYGFSVPFEDFEGVSFEVGSGLVLVEIDRAEGKISVATSGANPGEWDVIFTAPENARCVGELTVNAPS